ncbi:TetR family transcriptional regulator [Frondihabitans sp. PhB188]|uniref:TetR/AcrR family transcriptional regulator n=1 Tax=Frondihabitans sp. PhB188 TaxID=2485200 RepID=UPI000F4928F2|nr:TetR family transcriptional regulator [Frondihabitans sp. PhB188]ROQ38689.1 TetR family transcriptional regulator [Frondihabitans sp. PhB188]
MAQRRPLAETRQLLVDAAIRVIARQGVASASTRAITAEARVPLSAFHYAFDSYDHLIDRVIESVTEGERAIAVAAVEIDSDVDADLETVVLRALDLYLDVLAAHPDQQQALLELMAYAQRTPGLEGRARDYYASSFALAEGALATRAGVEWTVPPAEIARLAIVLLDGLTTTWLADRDTEAARRTARLAAASLAGFAAQRVQV